MSEMLQCRKVHRFRMEPTVSQQLELERTAGVSRFVYNWALDKQRQAYQTTGKNLSWGELSKQLTALKRQEPWLYDFDSQMLQQGLANLRRAFENFFAKRARYPKFKKKKASCQSFRIPQRVRLNHGKLYVPTIGWIRIRQSEEVGNFKSATFKRTAVGYWSVTLVSEFEIPKVLPPVNSNTVVGFDMVLQPPHFLVGSDGSKINAPRFYRQQEKKLRRAQRHWSRCQEGSCNRRKARLRVAKVHERTANLRKEFLPQLSHSLVQQWDVLGFEDLNLKSLAKIKHAKSWFDASFGEFLRQIEYKTLWNNKRMVWVDKFFPSSQLCSECGYKHDNLGLSERQWKCPGCATQHIRDFNAAQNVRAEVLRMLAVGYTESRNACGRGVRLVKASCLD